MNKSVYVIKKTLINNGKKIHVLVTDGSSEVLEILHKNIADKMVEVFNANTDSGCSYKVVKIGKDKEKT
tara:strand:+ start:186 stop:392 length:207 start_codon:yes stop_codon:yes gene_type:complete